MVAPSTLDFLLDDRPAADNGLLLDDLFGGEVTVGRPETHSILAVDLFCGAGGTSTGLQLAAKRLGRRLKLLAINHWDLAIETHSANHPLAVHKCESLDNVNPRTVVPGGRLDLLVASPECTHHSNARGGMPISEQSRASAWMVVRWAEALNIESILIENVPEFQSWGPVYEDCTCGAGIEAKKHEKKCRYHRPIPKLKGRIYRSFLSNLRALGYQVSTRVLCAADYGDPTTRKRLFILARKSRKPHWPEPTHSKTGGDLFGERPKWRPAREIIDWSVKGKSIFFNRQKPLAPNTMKRIEHGLKKFGAKVQPFIVQGDMGGSVHAIDEPLPTVTSADAWGLAEPFLMPVHHGEDLRTYSVDNPLPTITGFDGLGMIEPYLVEYYGTGSAESLDDPLNTVTGRDRFGLVEPFITEYHGGKNGDKRVHSVDLPLPTQDTSNRFGLVEPLILRGPDGRYYLLDIRYRMLMPKELAAAMSFPKDYVFSGNREDTVKQIGNAVPVSLASWLCQALLS
jgi:DNA (cytosine-5)-methyltransferase 1